MRRWLSLVSTAAIALSAICLTCCKRWGMDRDGAAGRTRDRGTPVALSPTRLSADAEASGARILLSAEVLANIREAARSDAPSWRAVAARCQDAEQKDLPSGYQGFEWASAVATAALCFHATGEARHATTARRYLEALLDDRFRVGDGQGGASVVTHDSGYGARTFAAYSALGYDWLRRSPSMDRALENRIATRLGQWLEWYGAHGYLRDEPLSNYYWGYLTSLAFAGLAFSGQLPAADVWLARAREELARNVLPTLRDRLGGGGWPEGWQYGEYTTLEIALTAKAFQTAAGVDVPRQMPWLGRVVTHHVHALLPDERTVYDGGTWGEHPAKPSGLALTAVAFALDGSDALRAAQARFMATRVLPPLPREHAWLGLLAAAENDKLVDPRDGAATSLHLAGQGLTFVRSDWSRSAVWVAFQAGPFLTPDHQHKDQGHFELWRGGDGLIVDGGDGEGSATINHNTLLVDDGGRTLNYTPNQGVWGSAVRSTRFGDDGLVLVTVGDLADAYSPKCVEDGCPQRVVRKLQRTLVFVRPSLLVVDDRLTLDRASDGATWIAHLTTPPVVRADHISALVGASRVDIRMLEPETATREVVREPTASGEGPHRSNRPWGPMWRIEVTSQRGARERGFLAVISADRRAAAAPPVRRVSGNGMYGSVTNSGSRGVAVLFADERGGSIALGGPVRNVVVAGLPPGDRFRTRVAADCSLTIERGTGSSGLVASLGGFVRIDAGSCGQR